MQITPDQLFAEAGAMALELRLKDQVIGRLEAENEALRQQLAAPPTTVPEDSADD